MFPTIGGMDSPDIVCHTEQRKINDLIPFDGNPRTLTEKQVSDLKKSIQKFNEFVTEWKWSRNTSTS
jgi:hypothetical protein